MKFIVSAAALRSALLPLLKVINRSTVLPVLETFHFQVTDQRHVRITATDLETVMHVDVMCEVVRVAISSGVCLEAHRLMKLLSVIADQPITFLLQADIMLIQGDDFEVKMKVEDGGNYPKTAVAPADAAAGQLPSEILPLLKKAIKFVSRDDLRPAMTGVFLHDYHGKLALAATDAHRLYYAAVPLPGGLQDAKIILPAKGVRLLLDAAKGRDMDVQVDKERIYLSFGDYWLSTRLIDAKYPEYWKVFPETDKEFHLIRKDLRRLLMQASIFANGSTSMVKMQASSQTGQLELSSADLDYDHSFSARMAAEKFNTELSYLVGVNVQFLMQTIALSDDPYVRIQTTGSQTQALVIDNHVIVMPLMLNEYN